MTRRLGWRKDKASAPDSSNEPVSASGRGAAAVGGDVSGIVSTGSNATNVQLGDVFLTVDTAGLMAAAVDEDQLVAGHLKDAVAFVRHDLPHPLRHHSSPFISENTRYCLIEIRVAGYKRDRTSDHRGYD